MRFRTDELVRAILCLYLAVAVACGFRTVRPFQLLPATPQYVIQSPDLQRIPYNQVLEDYTPQGRGWIELQPGMGLYIQNAVFRGGSNRRDLSAFIGVESIRYLVDNTGEIIQDGQAIRMALRPDGAPRIDDLVSSVQRKSVYHQFLYQVLVKPTDSNRVAMLVSADSRERLHLLTEAILTAGGSFSDDLRQNYTIFPDTASVAVEVTILLDKSPTRVLWGSKLSDVAADARRLKLFRLYKGGWRRVRFDPEDPLSLAVPLLPGDRVER